jgi:hypothetical protein
MNINISHYVTLFPQPTLGSCWSAAATMLFGDRSVGRGSAKIGGWHTVARGESLSKIAKLYGISHWREIYDHPKNQEIRRQRTDPNIIQPDDRWFVPSDFLRGGDRNIHSFANSHGLILYGPMSWTVEGLARLLSRGPLMLIGSMPFDHAVVLAAMQGDGTPKGTLLTIYDPLPPNIGTINRNVPYQDILNKFPSFITYVLHR